MTSVVVRGARPRGQRFPGASLLERAVAAGRARVTPGVADLAVGLVALAVMLVERFAHASAIGGRLPLALGCSVAVAAGLALRRRLPVGGYLLGSAGLAVEALFTVASVVSPYPNLVGIYSLGLYARGRRVWLGPPLALAGVAAYFGTGVGSTTSSVGVVFSWLLAWALGYSTARRRQEQQAAQALQRTRAVAEERTRIARDLHDLVGHAVTLMLVQVGAARRLLDQEPERTRELLSAVEATGRDALDELDRMLGMLRQTVPAAGSVGVVEEPGLANLATLGARMGQAGMRVTVDAGVDPAVLPASVSLCGYRIVQEALTNSLRHGHAATARVALRRSATALEIEVADDGLGVRQGYRPGGGLLGIGERVAMFGGSVTHGGGEGGGFRVRATLPLP